MEVGHRRSTDSHRNYSGRDQVLSMWQTPNLSRVNRESIDIARLAVIDEKSSRSIADLMLGAVEKHPPDHQY